MLDELVKLADKVPYGIRCSAGDDVEEWFQAWQRKVDARKHATHFNEDSRLAQGRQLLLLETLLAKKSSTRVTNKVVIDEFRRRLETKQLVGNLDQAGALEGGESPSKPRSAQSAVARNITYLSKIMLVVERFTELGGKPLVDTLRGKEITQTGESTWCSLMSLCQL